MADEMTAEYAQRVGDRLRDVRKQQRLSLQGVETASGTEFKASVLGAYERGERAISVPRLQRLAQFYKVPVDQLLPRTNADPDGAPDDEGRGHALGPITIDLTRLGTTPDPPGHMLRRYLSMIQVKRQDFNGRVLTVREDDVAAIACMLETEPDHLRHRLTEMGLCS